LLNPKNYFFKAFIINLINEIRFEFFHNNYLLEPKNSKENLQNSLLKRLFGIVKRKYLHGEKTK